MKSLIVICRDKKEQSLIKTFSGGKFKIRFCSTPREGIQGAIRNPVDLILFDLDKQSVSQEQFIKDLRSIFIFTPVIVLSSTLLQGSHKEGQSHGVAGSIKKPASQSSFLKTINAVMKQQVLQVKKEMAEGRESVEEVDSELLVGFRKDATIYKVSKFGMVLFLPTAIALESRILFKGTPLYEQLGVSNDGNERIELVVVQCQSTANNRFKITAHFADTFSAKAKSRLDQHVEQHAQKCVSVSRSAPNILILGDSNELRQTYRFYFKDSSYETMFAVNAADVFEKLHEFRVDLLIIDTDHLEDMGVPVIQGFKKRKIRMPIMLITGQGNAKLLTKYAPLVQDVIMKPVNGKALLKRMKGVFERWKAEVKVEQEIGENLGVHLTTRILVAFRDSAVIKRVRKDGLLLFKEQPIVPTTTIYCKASTLFKNMGLEEKNVTHLELTVGRCDPLEDGKGFRILSKFKDTPSDIHAMIDSFVNGDAVQSGGAPEETAPAGDHSDFSLAEFEKQLPHCKVELVAADKVEEAFFAATPREYVRQLHVFRRKVLPFQGEIQRVADQQFPKVDADFTSRKMDHITARREQSITFRIYSDTTEAYLQMGAILTTIPKGMGISASLVEDQYRYDPYFNFGIPGNPHDELGAPLEVRSIGQAKVPIYDFNKDRILSYVKTILGLIQ